MITSKSLQQLILITIFSLFGFILIRTAWIGDDALITIRTVLNYVHGNGLVFNVGERVQAYTHTLWFFMLSFSYWIVGNIYYSTFILSVITTLLSMFIVVKYISISFINAFVVLALSIFSIAFIDYGTSGLENPMSYLLIAWLVYRFIEESKKDFSGKLYIFWFILALIFLNRPDLILMALPLILYVTYQKYIQNNNITSIIKNITIGLSPMILWILFSLFYYGFPLPNTAYAKLSTGLPQIELIMQGFLYYIETIKHDPFTLIIIITSISISFYTKDRLKVLLSIGILIYGLYILKIGGDFMSGRFFSVPFFVSLLILATFPIKEERVHYTIFAILIFIGFISTSKTGGILRQIDYTPTEEKMIKYMTNSGISDERLYYYISGHSLINSGRYSFTNGVNYNEPIEDKYDKVIDSCGGLGRLALNSGPNSYYVDTCALANPLLSKIPLAYDRKNWRIGHFLRHIPNRYNTAIKENTANLTDKNLTKYYKKIALITRGELWSAKRIESIVKMNLGYYNHWLNSYTSLEAQFQRKLKRLKKVEIPYSKILERKKKITGSTNRDTISIKDGYYLSIDLGSSRKIDSFDISFDWNDEYLVHFLYKGKLVHYYMVQGSYVKGLHHKFISLDKEIITDKIIIIPQRGDRRYRIGHFILY